MWAKPKSWTAEDVAWQKGYWTGVVMGAGLTLIIVGLSLFSDRWNIEPGIFLPIGLMLNVIGCIIMMIRAGNKRSV